MPVTKIASKWDSGNLIFHETASRADTHNVFTLAPGIVTVGNDDNDVDFKVFMGSVGAFALFDCDAQHVYFTGLSCTLDGDLDVEVGDISLVDDQDMEFGDSTDALIRWSTGDTDNESFVIALGDSNQGLHITDKGAVATDWNIAATTHPTLYIHSNTGPATDYLLLGNHNGTTAHIDVVGGTTLSLDIAGTPEVVVAAASTSPATSDSNALGTTSLMWSDLFLASLGVINFNAGNCLITHAAGILTVTGDISMSNAAGPSIQDEAATATVPTLCPDKAELDTGIGWQSDVIHIVLGGADEYSFSTTILEMNENHIDNCGYIVLNDITWVTGETGIWNETAGELHLNAVTGKTVVIEIADAAEYTFSAAALALGGNNLTGIGALGLTGAITISPTAAGTFIDFELETEWTGGTLIDADFGAGTVQASDAIGMFLDFAGGGFFPGVTDLDVIGYRVTTAALTQTANTTTYIGFDLPTAGALVNTNGTINWRGVNLQLPAITQTSGTVVGTGVYITGAVITTGGTLNGVLLTGNFSNGVDMSGTYATGIDMTGTYSTAGISIVTTMAAHDDYAIYIATSCADTSDTVIPLYIDSVTTAACKARAAEFRLTPTAQLGQWANVVKTLVDLTGASGASGLLASLCAEILLPNEAMTGTMTALELELTSQSGFVANEGLGSNCVSFINTNTSGTDKGEIDDHGYFLNVQGLESLTTQMLYNNTLKCVIGTTKWYLPFSSVEGTYTSAYDIVTTGNLTVGAAGGGAGSDAHFYGTTNGAYLQWDEGTDNLLVFGAASIDFANAIPQYAITNAYILIGSNGTPLAVDASNGEVDGMQICLVNTANGAADVVGLRLRVSQSTGEQATVGLRPLSARASVSQNCSFVYPIEAYLDISADKTITNEVVGVNSTITRSSNCTVTGGIMDCFRAILEGSFNPAASAMFHGDVYSGTATTGLRLEAQAGATMTNLIQITGSGTFTNFFHADATSNLVGSNNVGGATLDFTNWRLITCDLDGNTYYLVAARTIANS